VDIAYTEEELAEIETQKEQEEQQRLARQSEREKAYREKRKAQKIDEIGGEIVKTKVCPHSNIEFILDKQPTGVVFQRVLLSSKARQKENRPRSRTRKSL